MPSTPRLQPTAGHMQTCSVFQCLRHPGHYPSSQSVVTKGLLHVRAHPRPWGDPGNTDLACQGLLPHTVRYCQIISSH